MSPAQIHRHPLIILAACALTLAIVLGVLAELPRINWHRYVAASPVTIQAPTVGMYLALAVLTAIVGTVAAVTNRPPGR